MPAVEPQHVLGRIEIRLQRKYGHRNGERTRMPTLMPVMYALAGCGHLPYVRRPMDELGADGRRDRQAGSLVAFQDPERQVRGDQDARDEQRRQKAGCRA